MRLLPALSVGAGSLAFPCISTGACGFPAERAARNRIYARLLEAP